MCVTSGFNVACVWCLLLCIVCMVCGMRLHCMGGMCSRCDVSVMQVLCRFGVLLMCVYYESCMWCSCVFMVHV